MTGAFWSRGWAAFDPDPAQTAWAAAVRPLAEALLADPGQRAAWLRCGGTWFAGVNILGNDARGAVPDRGVPPLAGAAVDFIARELGQPQPDWDAAQISICLPGYPRPGVEETEAAARFRATRDAAHVDGLLRQGPEGRRHLGERHGFILGLPLNPAPYEAAPMVVYEGSHEIMRAAFADRLAGVAPEAWGGEDITDTYVAARRQCFAECARVPVHVPPGGAYVLHRLALHGVAPWAPGLTEPPHRAIAYFRPEPRPGRAPDWWLTAA